MVQNRFQVSFPFSTGTSWFIPQIEYFTVLQGFLLFIWL